MTVPDPPGVQVSDQAPSDAELPVLLGAPAGQPAGGLDPSPTAAQEDSQQTALRGSEDASESTEPVDEDESIEPDQALELALRALGDGAWDNLQSVAPFLTPSGRATVDAKLVQASRERKVTPWNAEKFVLPYLWKSGRTGWDDWDSFVSGLTSGDDYQVAVAVVLALRAEHPPEGTWFRWIRGRHRLPDELDRRVTEHLTK
ncbi:MAG: hypothetical protein R3F05_02155 [Planctomycetota bacterium]